MPATRISLNGRLCDPAEALVPALDRGFLYGDGVFEVLRTYGGAAFALDEHLARLRASAALLGMSLPVPLLQLAAELRDALASARHDESHLRVLVTRGAGDAGLAPANVRDATRMIVVSPLAPPPRESYARGVRAIVVHAPWLAERGPLSGAKTLNYLANVMWTQQARAVGAAEALIVGAGDAVIEGASSNVFVVRGRTATTPPLDAGILGGVTRAFVLACAGGAGVTAREAPVTLDDVRTADEVFITSSVRELLPIVRVDAHDVGDGAPGVVTRALHRALRALTPASGAPMPWE